MHPRASVRPARPSPRGERIVTAVLLAPLLLLLLVFVRTWRAEQRYEAVTRRVVHDYAAIAAWQYARRASAALHDETMRAFSGTARGHQRTGPIVALQPAAAILASAAAPGDSVSAFARDARFALTYDGVTGRLDLAGAPVDTATRAMLGRRLRALADERRPDRDPHRVLFDTSGGAAHAIALWTIATPDRPFRGVYGLAADPGVLRARLAQVAREPGLLPATAAAVRLRDGDLVVRLARRDGGIVFAAGGTVGATAATDSTGLLWGEVRTTVDLSPALAAALLVGGPGASQLPSLALMLLAAGLLAAIGLAQQRRRRELERLRGRFVADVSHELRTPLAQISLFAETLALGRERSVAEGRQFASIIHAEARRLTTLVESILTFSRAQAAPRSLRAEPTTIAPEIVGAVEAFAPIAGAADASLVLRLDEGARATIDRAAFRQLILNLLDNAVKHGGRGVAIEIALAREAGRIHLVVDDSGPGVPPEWRERVFQPFVRIERGGSGGAGIGLAVVRDVVSAHGGTIHVDRSPLGGARFVVTLAAAAPEPERLAEHAPAAGVAS